MAMDCAHSPVQVTIEGVIVANRLRRPRATRDDLVAFADGAGGDLASEAAIAWSGGTR
jgi:hypothetical protein